MSKILATNYFQTLREAEEYADRMAYQGWHVTVQYKTGLGWRVDIRRR